MGRRSDHTRDELRELMLNAARAIVVAQGVEGLTVRKIAADIGYTVGTLYNVFANLDDLILHMNGRTLDMLHHEMAEKLAPCETPEEGLCAIASFYIRFSKEHYPLWRLIFEHHMTDSYLMPPWYREKVSVMYQAICEILKDVMTSATEQEVKRVAQVLWAGIHGICVLSMSEELSSGDTEDDPPEELAESLIMRCTGMHCAVEPA